MIDKDVRRMSVRPKPDGTPPDLSRPADILIYEARTVSLPCCAPPSHALEHAPVDPQLQMHRDTGGPHMGATS